MDVVTGNGKLYIADYYMTEEKTATINNTTAYYYLFSTNPNVYLRPEQLYVDGKHQSGAHYPKMQDFS